MTNETNNTTKRKSKVARWIIGGIFAMCALVNGFHYSSLFFLISAALMFPLSFIESYLQKMNVKTVVAIILSVVLFVTGTMTSPLSEPVDPSADETTQSITTTTEDTESNTEAETKKEEVTTEKQETTKAETETKVVMVWVSSTGSKYHSKSSCSGMKSPWQIPLEEAKQKGLTACGRCY